MQLTKLDVDTEGTISMVIQAGHYCSKFSTISRKQKQLIQNWTGKFCVTYCPLERLDGLQEERENSVGGLYGCWR